jgi:hypothetical protein
MFCIYRARFERQRERSTCRRPERIKKVNEKIERIKES